MLVNGLTIWLTVKESFFMPMEICMEDSGQEIGQMVMELTLAPKVIDTKVIGKTISSMDTALSNGLLEKNTREIFNLLKRKALGNINMLMAHPMKVHSWQTGSTDTEPISGQMENVTSVSGLMMI